MTLLIEILANATTTLGVYGGAAWAYKHYWPRRKRNITGVYLWKRIYTDNTDNNTFSCPKCLCNNIGQPPICSCEEYHYEHFHLKCNRPDYSCGYTCIVRTVDDIE